MENVQNLSLAYIFIIMHCDKKLLGKVQKSRRQSKSLKDESLFIKWLRVLCALVSNTECAALFLLRQRDEYK